MSLKSIKEDSREFAICCNNKETAERKRLVLSFNRSSRICISHVIQQCSINMYEINKVPILRKYLMHKYVLTSLVSQKK